MLNSPWLDLQGSFLVRTAGTEAINRLGSAGPYATVPRTVTGVYVDSLHRDHHGEWDFDLAVEAAAELPGQGGLAARHPSRTSPCTQGDHGPGARCSCCARNAACSLRPTSRTRSRSTPCSTSTRSPSGRTGSATTSRSSRVAGRDARRLPVAQGRSRGGLHPHGELARLRPRRAPDARDRSRERLCWCAEADSTLADVSERESSRLARTPAGRSSPCCCWSASQAASGCSAGTPAAAVAAGGGYRPDARRTRVRRGRGWTRSGSCRSSIVVASQAPITIAVTASYFDLFETQGFYPTPSGHDA